MPPTRREARRSSTPPQAAARADRTKVLSVRLTSEELDALTARAIETGVGPSTLARTLVRRGLGIGPTEATAARSAGLDPAAPAPSPPSTLEARLAEHLTIGLAARVEALERWVAEH